MNSRHAEILLDLTQHFEGFSEIRSVGCSFEDSVGRENLHCKVHLEFEVLAKKPERSEK